jgi:hypothetical protein
LPQLEIDKLSTILTEFAPDIVHISAHGEANGLLFSDSDGTQQFVNTSQLIGLFRGVAERPTLIYVSACSADLIAKELVNVVPFAIGSTATVSDDAARRSALKFYEWLGRGYSIAEAFEVSKPLLEIVDRNTVTLTIEQAGLVDPKKQRFVERLRMLASFTRLENARDDIRRGAILDRIADRSGDYEIELGLAGCPRDTLQVIFSRPTVASSTSRRGDPSKINSLGSRMDRPTRARSGWRTTPSLPMASRVSTRPS